jgi:hypothetical protein
MYLEKEKFRFASGIFQSENNTRAVINGNRPHIAHLLDSKILIPATILLLDEQPYSAYKRNKKKGGA